MQRQETLIESECVGCGVTFQQRDDAGRRREYHSRACRQRAYRARSGRDGHEARRESQERARRAQEDERQRMYEEAWAEREAQRERERQRSQRRRYGFTPPAPETMPSWCFPVPGEPARKARARDRAYKLYSRALRPTHDDDQEAKLARESAERIRAAQRL